VGPTCADISGAADSGTPLMVRVWDQSLRYTKSQRGVAFLRKDEIARYALQGPLTLRENETI